MVTGGKSDVSKEMIELAYDKEFEVYVSPDKVSKPVIGHADLLEPLDVPKKKPLKKAAKKTAKK